MIISDKRRILIGEGSLLKLLLLVNKSRRIDLVDNCTLNTDDYGGNPIRLSWCT